MQLQIKKATFPEVIEFNFEELKTEITARTADYINLVYTENQLSEARKDKAQLNKFSKALSEERIRIKKECLKPYEKFETKIKELDDIVQKAISNIDAQIKASEEKEKTEKLEQIKAYWNSKKKPFEIDLLNVFEKRWLNKTFPFESVKKIIDEFVERVEKDLVTLSNLPEFTFEATEVYKSSLDLSEAISTGKRLAEIQKRKTEKQERLKAEAEARNYKETEVITIKTPLEQNIVADEKQAFEYVYTQQKREWVSFRAFLTVEDAQQLANFFAVRGIKYEPIEI